MTELESEAMEAEFDTVAGWTEEAVRALGPEYAVPAGCRGSGSEGGCAGWPTGSSSARGPGCSTRARASAGRPAGSRRSAGPPRSAPSPWPPPSGPPVGCSACRRWSPWGSSSRSRTAPSTRPGASASSHDVGQAGRARRAAAGGADGRPARPPGLRRRRPAAPAAAGGQRVPLGVELLGLLAEAGFELLEAADADLGDSPAEWTERADAVEAEVDGGTGTIPRSSRRRRSEPRRPAVSDGDLRAWLGFASTDAVVH